MKLMRRPSEFLNSLRVEVTLISGRSKANGEVTSIICVIGGKTEFYLAELLFESDYKRSIIGITWLWNVVQYAEKHAPDASRDLPLSRCARPSQSNQQ